MNYHQIFMAIGYGIFIPMFLYYLWGLTRGMGKAEDPANAMAKVDLSNMTAVDTLILYDGSDLYGHAVNDGDITLIKHLHKKNNHQ